MKNLIFCLSVLSLLFACGSHRSETHKGVFMDLSPREFSEKMKANPGQLLDVRTEDEIAEGKIEGAVDMDFYADDFSDQLSSLKTDQPVYVYCAAGRRGGKAMRIMAELGFTEVYNLAGGIGAWMDEKMPIDKP